MLNRTLIFLHGPGIWPLFILGSVVLLFFSIRPIDQTFDGDTVSSSIKSVSNSLESDEIEAARSRLVSISLFGNERDQEENSSADITQELESSDISSIKLLATVKLKGPRLAYVVFDDEIIILSEKEELRGWRIKSVESSRVTLVKNNEEFELKMFDSKTQRNRVE